MRPSRKGSRGRRGGSSRRSMSEINVTPFVDVMLVLLVIFMVAAPMMTVGVDVDLPEARTNPIQENKDPLVITVTREGKIFIQETEVENANLVPRLQAITQNNTQARLFLRADRGLDYGEVMRVMGRLNTAGYNKIALIADLPGRS